MARKFDIKSALIRCTTRIVGGFRWLVLKRAARNPDKAQRRILRKILAQNADTTFGSEHSFSTIDSISSFQNQVAIQSYDSLQSYILRQRDTHETALTDEKPVLYAQTSGTTGVPKFIPMTRSAIKDLKNQQQLVTYHFYKTCPQAFEGDALAIVSPAVEGNFSTGIPFGSASGSIHNAMPAWVREKFVVPPSVFALQDYDLKYKIILCLGLAKSNITYIACANPSTLVRLLSVLNEQCEILANCIESGNMNSLGKIPDTMVVDLSRKFNADPKRADLLRKLANEQKLNINNIWPELKLITTWTSGSCGVALSSLSRQLPNSVKIMDIGFLASELRSTITIDIDTQSGLPLLQDHFYEFVEQQSWEQGDIDIKLIHELVAGKTYYILVTTKSGLYRYFLNDIVEVTGYYLKTPIFKFLQKGKGVTNITGEKLYEAQLLESVNSVMSQNNLPTVFIMALADEKANHYQVFVETQRLVVQSPHEIASSLDDALRRCNVEYDCKRNSGRLHHLQLYWLREGAYEAYKRFSLSRGQREGQYKLIALQYRKDFVFNFDQWIKV